MDRWSLPGPAGFIEDVVLALREGANVVVGAPINVARVLTSVLEDRLDADSWPLTRPFHPEDQPPIDALYAELDIHDNRPSNRSVASLIRGMQRKSVVMPAGLERAQWPAWKVFLEEYARASRQLPEMDRTQLLVVTAGVPKDQLPGKAPALQCFVWDGRVGEADVFSYVALALRQRAKHPHVLGRLLARIITRVGAWDFDLVDHLLALEWRDLFDPHNALLAIAELGPQRKSVAPTWEDGDVAEFDGDRLFHALALVRSGDAEGELSMRLWAAQAGELLPEIELRRRDLAKRMKRTRAIPPSLRWNDEPVADLLDVEIGDLMRIARRYRLPSDIQCIAERYWLLRNKLAHLQPATADEVYELLTDRKDK